MSRRWCAQAGAARPPSQRPLRSRLPASHQSLRRVPASRAVRSVARFPGGEHRLIDALAVVSHPQSEVIAVVADLDLDPSGLRVPKSIPQRFRRNLVDLVTKDRVQVPRLSLDRDAECGRLGRARVGCELVAQGSDRHREIVTFDGRRP